MSEREQTCTACAPNPKKEQDWYPVRCVGGPLDGERHNMLGYHDGRIDLRGGHYVLDRGASPHYLYRWHPRPSRPTGFED